MAVKMHDNDRIHLLDILRRGGSDEIPEEVLEEYWLDMSTRNNADPMGPDNLRRITGMAELRHKKEFFRRVVKPVSSLQEGVSPPEPENEQEADDQMGRLKPGTKVLVREQDPSSSDDRWVPATVRFHKPRTGRYACNLEGQQQGFKEFKYDDVKEAVLQEA